MIPRTLVLAVLASASAAAAGSASAYQVQPLVSHAKPSGAGATIRLVVRNTDPSPITLELSPFKVTVDENGVETRTPEDATLLVFPPQTVIPPNREQAVQVRYIGSPTLAADQIYGVLISQLPVAFQQLNAAPNAQTDLKVGFNFRAYMIVDAPGAKSATTVSPVIRRPDGDLSLEVENSGSAVSLLHGVTWTFSDTSGHSVTLDSDHVKAGEFGALLPGQKRSVTVDNKDVSALTGEVHAVVKTQ